MMGCLLWCFLFNNGYGDMLKMMFMSLSSLDCCINQADLTTTVLFSTIIDVVSSISFGSNLEFVAAIMELGFSLAIAADENFKTFEAAYPYVVRKLLTDDSPASRRILHSVMLTRRREFQWQRLALFLRVGATRKRVLSGSSTMVMESPGNGLVRSSGGTDNSFDVSTFVLRLLPSKDGTVLRRLLMTADGRSMLRAFLSREATTVRQNLCRAIADVIYQWMSVVITKIPLVSQPSQTYEANSNYQLLLTDRRLKVVLRKMLNDARRDWWLMLRFSWTSFVMIVKASAMACHRLCVSLSEANVKRISYAPLEVTVST